MQRPEILDKMATYLLQVQENRIKQNSVLTNLIKEKRQTENTINNIMQAIELGGQSATVMKRMRELEEKLTDIEKRLTIEKSQTAFRLSKEQIIDYYKSALEKEPLQLINYFIKEIQLYDDKMIIIYNTPKTINLDDTQTIYSTVFLTRASAERVDRQINRQPTAPRGLFVCLWQDSLTHSFLTSRTFRGIKPSAT